MPALMAQRSSATRNQILRELERRRKSFNVANGRVMKKQSSASPALPPRLIPSVALKLANAPREGVAKKGSASLPLTGVLIPTGAPGAARKKITYLDLGEAPKRQTLPQRSREALTPCAFKAPKPAAFIPHAPAAATKLSATTSHEHEKTGAETRYIKKPSSAPIQPLHSSSILLKKGSASLPLTGVLIPTGAPGAARKKITYLDLGEAPKRPTLPQRSREGLIPFAMKEPKPTAFIPHAPAAATKLSATTSHEHEKTGAETRYIKKPSSAPIQPLHSSSILVKKGMTVKMRTSAGTLPTGERLVILNHAVVVSDVSEDGYVEVVYKGNSHYPPMRIALDQVKIMPPTK